MHIMSNGIEILFIIWCSLALSIVCDFENSVGHFGLSNEHVFSVSSSITMDFPLICGLLQLLKTIQRAVSLFKVTIAFRSLICEFHLPLLYTNTVFLNHG